MTQFERNQSILKKYIPEDVVPVVALWVVQLDFKLKIKKERSTKHGDYRSPANGLNHQITINRNLNKYAFFITLVHEVAHLCNWNKFKNRVKPHGEEWKQEFKTLMHPFLTGNYFPQDVLNALRLYMENPAASSCSDANLMRVLKKYDAPSEFILVEDLAMHSVFRTKDNRHFIKGEKRRTRFVCVEKQTKKVYLFSGLAEVYMARED